MRARRLDVVYAGVADSASLSSGVRSQMWPHVLGAVQGRSRCRRGRPGGNRVPRGVGGGRSVGSTLVVAIGSSCGGLRGRPSLSAPRRPAGVRGHPDGMGPRSDSCPTRPGARVHRQGPCGACCCRRSPWSRQGPNPPLQPAARRGEVSGAGVHGPPGGCRSLDLVATRPAMTAGASAPVQTPSLPARGKRPAGPC